MSAANSGAPSRSHTPQSAAASVRDDDASMLSDVVLDTNAYPSVQPSAAQSAAPSDNEQEDDQIEPENENEEAEEEEEAEEGEDDDTKVESKETRRGTRRESAATTVKKQQKRERDTKLSEHREEIKAKQLADSIKRFSYLLGQTDVFNHFCELKKQREPEFAAMLAESEKALNDKKKSKSGQGRRGRKSEKEEDAELLVAEEHEGEENEFVFTESPSYVKNGTLRDYQLQGLNWMIGLHANGLNGILADEMGLGKTLQTISFLGYLKYHRNIDGPHLVVVPKSTVENWSREFKNWVPGFNAVVLSGNKDERQVLVQERILKQDFDVCITSYEICQREKSALKKMSWEYIIIDEAHRIKNSNSMLSQIVRLFESANRLLITGTPLQNDLHELWSLLNFLLPDVFSNSEDFDKWFEQAGNDNKDGVVQQLHKVLRPFLLRRVKSDVEKSLLPKKELNVYVGMTDMQRKWYRMLLEKDIDAVNGAGGRKEGKTRLLNIVMQLRKCCNHPYLFDGAEPGPPFTTDEHLVDNSGKMIVLDKLLKSLKAKGSRVLIFSQMSRVLDILEDYCLFREYQYCRIDGSSVHEDRLAAIDEYNKPDSEKFVFLLTTRAGGLGINLTSADIVILYDSDWNPQADLQAMDRAHRIGQKKQVFVFRFITENAVEEKVLERATQKLRLDQLVIQQGRAAQNQKAANKDELVEMIQHGAEKIISGSEDMSVGDDIDEIIKRGEEKTKELQSKYAEFDFDDLANFKSEAHSTTNWEGEEFGGRKKQQNNSFTWIQPGKRSNRASNYSVDAYYRNTLRPGEKKPAGPRKPKGLGQIQANDFQFFPARLVELQEKELAYYRKQNDYVVPLGDDPNKTKEELDEERKAAQEVIKNATELTEDEEREKEELSQLGFDDWSRKDFNTFLRATEAYGKEAYDMIAREIGGEKTPEDVEAYANVFWDRYDEIDKIDSRIAKIEEAEKRREKDNKLSRLLQEKVESQPHPLQQLQIHYINQTKGKSYNEEEDRFLIVSLSRIGVGREDAYERVKRDILEWPAFRFNWWIKSRTPQEIGRRCKTLTELVEREFEAAEEGKPSRKRGSNAHANGDTPKSAATAGKKRKSNAIDSPSASRASTPASGTKKRRS